LIQKLAVYQLRLYPKKREKYHSIFLATQWNLSSENGEFEKKTFLKIWRDFGPFFSTKNPFHKSKACVSGQILIKTG
jgi:hypothetical protein